ncbi:hypothetical protein I2483_07905 [Sporosarcina sp. E16_3]|uniref:hypothetical protein n=1 Tax=Sporosarcina sp. E16_3 TaxID=2789293 RepID=UPI001A93027E|nr:hypothetical protein [Sporosarcina sp. E16_3]MBO0601583.1 hypothetical protein [Sporosarcina sp. E16_3]
MRVELANKKDDLDFTIRELAPSDKKYSILSQFFLALGARDMNGVTSLFLLDHEMTEQSLREVIAHFDNRKVIMQAGLPVEVMLSQPSSESLAVIRSQSLNPIIKSLFEANYNDCEWRPQERYTVIPDYIEKYESEEFDEVLAYLRSVSKIAKTTLRLDNWMLEDSLKDSFAIRYFAHKCSYVYLWIDITGRITMIELDLA